ncbi:hypothetical protein B0T24DRAFT_675167 [Lasiosphaeria ovina]|uniref:SnoaL-like domain-containing protein n=1 Tax=Lasiosphaeria ovina TaxID=92902 RepID=A0AAE0KNF5_9PEZI|nr:hypothetical protein B0T24DRAFT_675167 [Lasiosphaeria ovina]
MDTASYAPAYPSAPAVDPALRDFVARFFATSDTPGLTDEWLAFFSDDATVVMGSETATGIQEIRSLRLRMWDKVEARKHHVAKVFPGSFDDEADTAAELMLFGSVAYVLKQTPATAAGAGAGAGAGTPQTATDWAAHARLKRNGVDSPWAFVYYRVYLQK